VVCLRHSYRLWFCFFPAADPAPPFDPFFSSYHTPSLTALFLIIPPHPITPAGLAFNRFFFRSYFPPLFPPLNVFFFLRSLTTNCVFIRRFPVADVPPSLVRGVSERRFDALFLSPVYLFFRPPLPNKNPSYGVPS